MSFTTTTTSPIVTQSVLSGILNFVNEGSRLVSFAAAQPNANYRVIVQSQADPVYFWVTNKTVNDFVINASISYTGPVGFDVFE